MSKTAKTLVFILAVCLLIPLAACGNSDSLTSKWVWAPDNDLNEGYQEIWEFKSDGTLIITGNFDGAVPDVRKYEVSDNQLTITFAAEEENATGFAVFHFVISNDGKTLTITANGIEPMILTRL